MSVDATLKQLQAGRVGIGELLKAQLPMKAKYAVGRLADRVQEELEKFDKARDRHFRAAGCTTQKVVMPNPKAGQENERDTIEVEQYVHPEGEAKLKELNQQVEDMMGATVSLPCHPLDIEQFGNATISGPAFLGLTGWAFKDDNHPAAPAKTE